MHHALFFAETFGTKLHVFHTELEASRLHGARRQGARLESHR